MYAFYESRVQKTSKLSSMAMRPYPAHWHSDIEIIRVTAGTLEMTLNDKTYQLEDGDMCFIGTGEIHAYTKTTEETTSNIFFIRREWLGEYWALFYEMHLTNPLIKGNSLLAKKVNSMFDRIEQPNDMDSELFDDFKQKTLICSICLAFLESLEWQPYTEREYADRERKVERLHKILDFIDENYANDISLEDISGEMNFSPYYFSRFFKKATGMNFVKYLTVVRIQRSMRMLLVSDALVSEIAYDVGFGSIKTFNRVFKEVNGMSPLQYKKRKK